MGGGEGEVLDFEEGVGVGGEDFDGGVGDVFKGYEGEFDGCVGGFV